MNVDTSAQTVVLILGAIGGGAALPMLIKGVIDWLSGSAARERARNTDISAQRRKAVEERIAAEEDRDFADLKRREAEEHVSQLKRQLLENGIQPRERMKDIQ